MWRDRDETGRLEQVERLADDMLDGESKCGVGERRRAKLAGMRLMYNTCTPSQPVSLDCSLPARTDHPCKGREGAQASSQVSLFTEDAAAARNRYRPHPKAR